MNIGIVGSIAPGTCICVPTPPGPYPDVGVVMSGSPMDLDGGSPIARIGDIVMYSCGSSTIMSGMPMEMVMGSPISTTGSSVVGCGMGTLIGTSPDYMSM